MSQFNLLEKTELRIERLGMKGADLNQVAEVVAEVLGLTRDEVLVTDAQADVMAVDILRKTVDPYALIGKKDMLLKRLSQVPGLEITPETSICSEGMLGWIAVDDNQAFDALKKSEQMAAEIQQKISKRAIIFSTGPEVISGQIKDTNQPLIADKLESRGYKVKRGPAIKDDRTLIAARLREAVESQGYGLVITTGGVGAEVKDHTIEALQLLDPDAAVSYIIKFKVGTGRHAKDGVRIGVAEFSGSLIAALPGPNDEVRIGMEMLLDGLNMGLDKTGLAEKIASALREKLRLKMKHHH